MSTKNGTGRTERTEGNLTRAGNSLGVQGGEAADGEADDGTGTGARYTAVLRERTNKSLNRNGGPSRPSANTGEIPAVTQAVRKTGRV